MFFYRFLFDLSLTLVFGMMIIMSKSLYCSRTVQAGNLTQINTQLQNHAQ